MHAYICTVISSLSLKKLFQFKKKKNLNVRLIIVLAINEIPCHKKYFGSFIGAEKR